MLELEGVVKHYRGAGERVRAVDGVSLTVRAGEMVALYGPSGSGKTTLLLLIAALLRPERGTIRYDGREVSSLSEDEASDYLLGNVGFIYQNPHLMSRVSAIENAAMKLLLGGVPMREAQEQAIRWLERVGLGDRLQRTPGELSGGELQRVAIARALAGEPRLVLLDEPVSSLDASIRRGVIDLLGELQQQLGCAYVLVSHDFATVEALADRVAVMHVGKIVESGPAKQVLLEPKHPYTQELIAACPKLPGPVSSSTPVYP
jgi:putative ABC transport system ATP-binding protein